MFRVVCPLSALSKAHGWSEFLFGSRQNIGVAAARYDLIEGAGSDRSARRGLSWGLELTVKSSAVQRMLSMSYPLIISAHHVISMSPYVKYCECLQLFFFLWCQQQLLRLRNQWPRLLWWYKLQQSPRYLPRGLGNSALQTLDEELCEQNFLKKTLDAGCICFPCLIQ